MMHDDDIDELIAVLRSELPPLIALALLMVGLIILWVVTP